MSDEASNEAPAEFAAPADLVFEETPVIEPWEGVRQITIKKSQTEQIGKPATYAEYVNACSVFGQPNIIIEEESHAPA